MILLTGATGLVGSHILFQLISEGKQVRALYRSEKSKDAVMKVFSYYHPAAEALMKQVEWTEADILDIPALEEAMKGVDEIIHAAALVSFNPRRKREIFETNLIGTRNVVNMALEFGIKKFGYLSNVAAIGRGKNGVNISEDTEWQNSTQNSDYSLSKFQAEMDVWRGMEEGLKVVIINPSIILGPGFWSAGSGKLFQAVYNGFPFYSRGANAFVDVKDVANIMVRLMQSDIANQRFLVAAWNKSYREVMNAMAKEMKKPAPRLAANAFLIGVAWRIEKLSSLIQKKEPGLTKQTAAAGMRNNSYNSDKIVKALNYTFRPLDESIKEYSARLLNDLFEEKS